jgi:hypothetical protein
MTYFEMVAGIIVLNPLLLFNFSCCVAECNQKLKLVIEGRAEVTGRREGRVSSCWTALRKREGIEN